MTELKDAFDSYWSARKALQRADRDSLDARLTEQRTRLAKAIRERQAQKVSVTEMQDELGTGNRNFLYSILQGVPYSNEYAQQALPKQQSENGTDNSESKTAGWEYALDRAERYVWVSRPDQETTAHTYALDEHGFVTSDSFPEWMTDMSLSAEERAFYRGVIQDIERPATDARNALDMQQLDD